MKPKQGKSPKAKKKPQPNKKDLQPKTESATFFKKRKKALSGSLKEILENKLKGSHFRFLNEQLYTSEDGTFKKKFSEDPDLYKQYHEGFRHQVCQWPINPVDVIIDSVKRKSNGKKLVIADFGCGDAAVAKALTHCKVHSFDLVATNELVTVCDMKHTQLKKESVDISIFCLSLMGTNVSEYVAEANRVLKAGGLLKIAEVESRMGNVDEVISSISKHGFELSHQDFTHNLFYFLDFKKINNISKKRFKKLPPIVLTPCRYKRR